MERALITVVSVDDWREEGNEREGKEKKGREKRDGKKIQEDEKNLGSLALSIMFTAPVITHDTANMPT